MAINVNSEIAAWEAEYQSVQTKLSGLPGGSVSSMGRSLTANRGELMEYLKFIRETLAQLGAPIGEIGMPFVSVSRVRP